MKLGAFSVSLSVKDLQASKAFYQKLGFEKFGGEEDQRWLIMKNGDHIIGLFQGMFEGNVLTFNPGWDQDAQTLNAFDDVRVIQRHLQSQGVELKETADPDGSGPAHISLLDPDGNAILIDQHV
ncbi:VOC family protein [Reinekea sp. G2M2-21]|uniref:VOC family protein n=1 Tax=Reinekea sp. G2M2-21 TaxID=2788942 RepID=UPI0018AAB559|nr:VOC family protein [Reinekea sp. G2M2-21]